MSAKCKACGSTEIETDPARGDAVCTSCGVVLEDQLLVSHTAFEEGTGGNMVALGHFVASDATGATTNFGNTYHVNGRAAREITMANARRGITHLCQQLKLNQHCIEMSVQFYRMALERQLTRGRKHVHNHAACVYITCRSEGTSHLLIDISDVLQLDVHELGRTYLKFTQVLLLSIPSLDPCLYIMRFANKLEFGEKMHEVSMTALRLVQRMKRDSIHTGRRPSGLCGAALLIAARLHEFNRTPADIVKVVHVHESTLRKRMLEFGETPSSALTLDEFMTVDLEEEQDPPAFKAARKKDRERLQKVEDLDTQLDDLQNEINKQLEKKRPRVKRKRDDEEDDTKRFIDESTLDIIQNVAVDDDVDGDLEDSEPIGLGPNIASMNLPTSLHDTRNFKETTTAEATDDDGEFHGSDLDDDDEVNRAILSEEEYKRKAGLWEKVNETYLKEQQEKEEKRLKAAEEGKPEKKKRRTGGKKKNQGPAASAEEAIQKIKKEKKISNKINYDVLKSLKIGPATASVLGEVLPDIVEPATAVTTNLKPKVEPNVRVKEDPKIKVEVTPVKKVEVTDEIADEMEDMEDDYDDEEEVQNDDYSVGALMRQNFENGDDDEGGYDYGEEDY